jgi:hypothetical protein
MRGVSMKRRCVAVVRTTELAAWCETLEPRKFLSGDAAPDPGGAAGLTGAFVNPAPKGALTAGEGSLSFNWGEPVTEGGPSRVAFAPEALAAPADDVITLGRLDFYNGIIAGGTQAEAVTLSLSIRLPLGGQMVVQELNLPLLMYSTTNTDDPDESSDWVYLNEVDYPAVVFPSGGSRALRLEILGFGALGEAGEAELVTELSAMEEHDASTQLLARFSEVDVTAEGIDNAAAIAAFYEDFELEWGETEEDWPDDVWEDEGGDDFLDDEEEWEDDDWTDDDWTDHDWTDDEDVVQDQDSDA